MVDEAIKPNDNNKIKEVKRQYSMKVIEDPKAEQRKATLPKK